jgi:hypothetical protein
MDITQPFQTLSDVIWSFPIKIAYKLTHCPILSHWIILSLTHYRQASGPRGVFKFYQLNLSLPSSPARRRLKTAMTHQHSHLGIVLASYQYQLFGVTARSRDRGACPNW